MGRSVPNFRTGALGLYSEIFRKFWGPKFPGNFGVGNIWQLTLLFAPTSPRQPVPKFSGNFGTGDVLLSHVSQPKFSRKFWGRKHLAISRCAFRLKILRKFWDGRRCFTKLHETARAYLAFCAHLPPAACPKISRQFWDRRRSTLSCLPAQIFPEILGQTLGDYSVRFSLQNFPEILGRETLHHEITRDLKFLGNFGTVRPKFSRKSWTIFSLSRVKFLGKFRSHREIWNRSSGRQISRKFRSHEISREIWNRSSGAVFRNFQKILGSKISWKFWGRKHLAAYLTFCAHLPPAARPKIFRQFWDRRRSTLSRLLAQIFPEILGQETFGD